MIKMKKTSWDNFSVFLSWHATEIELESWIEDSKKKRKKDSTSNHTKSAML